MINLYRLFVVLFMTILISCAPSRPQLSAGNDEDQDIGLGGTGKLATSDFGLGGTGIRGVITGFGSIFVNGIEIEYNNSTPILINGKKATNRNLNIGDIVEVLTTDNQQYTNAQIINVRHEIIGKVNSIDTNDSSFTILNQKVLSQGINTSLPNIGDTVAVSGFRINEKTVQATNVKAASRKQSLLQTGYTLPFSKKASRWIIQQSVHNNKTVLMMNNDLKLFSLSNTAEKSTNKQQGIKILEVVKLRSGRLKFNRQYDSKKVPQGRSNLRPDTEYRQRNKNSMPRLHKRR